MHITISNFYPITNLTIIWNIFFQYKNNFSQQLDRTTSSTIAQRIIELKSVIENLDSPVTFLKDI